MSDEPTAQPPRKRAPAKKAAKRAAPRLASADTPAARRARDDAMGLPADEIEIVPPRPDAPRYGRRVPEGQVPALIASAAKIDLNDRNSLQHLRKRRQQWQTEAWDYFDEVGEIGYVITFIGNLLSKIRLYPAVRPDPKEAPIAVDDEGSGVDSTTAKIAIATLERLHSSQGGQSAIIRELAINFEVAGEAYLHGHEDPDTAEEDWQVRSVDELLVTGDQFALRTAPGAMQGEAVPKDDLVVRLWERHPRFCVDDETEILSRRGWLRHGDLSTDDEVLTLNHESGLSEWQTVDAVNRFPVADEPMVEINGQFVSSLTTRDHRWPVVRDNRSRIWKTSEQLRSHDHLVTAAPCADLPTDAKWSDAFVELVAWFWTEGSIAEGPRSAAVSLTQSHSVNPANVERIRRALTVLYGPASTESMRAGSTLTQRRECSTPGCDWPVEYGGLCGSHAERRRTGRSVETPIARRSAHPGFAPMAGVKTPQWREHPEPGRDTTAFWLNSAASSPLLDVAPRKVVSLEFIRELTAAQLALFIETSLDADGTRRGPTSVIAQRDPDRLDCFELACILSGRTPHSTTKRARYKGEPYDMRAVTASRKTTMLVANHRRTASTGKSSVPRPASYSGVVWCPTTKNGTWLARRRGTVYFTGNSEIATCALRRVLGEAESLLLLSREIRATSKSRLTAGILLVPSELSFGSNDPTRDSADGEVTDDPFDEELQTAMITPIQEEGSASAVVPLVLRGPAEFLKEVRHLILEKKLDAVLDARIEGRVMRIGRGLNMPVEVTTGLQETTFANAAQVKKSEWDSHGEPRAVLIVDALTAGYYQAALVEAGIPIEKARDIFVWFDPTEAIAAPDPTDNAEKAHEDGVISDEARRRVSGFSESDAPTNEELIRRILLRGVRLDSFIQAQLLKSTGLAPDIDIPAPASGIYGEVAPTPAAVVAASRLVELAAGRRAPLGAVLVGIDRDVRTRIRMGADAAMRRTLERAGNRLASKLRRSRSASFAREATATTPPRDMAATLGPAMLLAAGIEDEDLLGGAFEDFGADFLNLVGKAQADARRAVDKYFGPLPTPAEKALFAQQQAARDRAWSVLYGRLRDEAGIRLFSPVPSFAGPGEVDPSLTIPGSMIRQAMALAGGAQAQEERGAVTDTHGTPVGGVATGPDLMAAVAEVGGAVEAYEWDYGTAPRLHPFEPHELLDGVQFTNFDDDVLANDEGWPEAPFYFPGDHDGCVCDVTPVLIDSTTGEATVDLGD